MVVRPRSRVLTSPQRKKKSIFIIFDIVVLLIAFRVGFGLHHGNWYAPQRLDQWEIILSVALLAVPIFIRFGLYRAVLRYLPGVDHFGNVLGSTVPLFKRQIASGVSSTLTASAMPRYSISVQEAAELIVRAGVLSKGRDIFLLNIGEPMLISDLSKISIRPAGPSVRSDANPNGDIKIVATGKRPGEKLCEELLYDAASPEVTGYTKIRVFARAFDFFIPRRLIGSNIA